MALGPLQVHAHQHLDPVLRLHPALAHRDGYDRVVVGVGIGEQQVELVRVKLLGQRRALLRDLFFELGIVLRQLIELDEITCAPFEPVPGRDQLAVLRGLSGHRAGAPWIVPNAGLDQPGV